MNHCYVCYKETDSTSYFHRRCLKRLFASSALSELETNALIENIARVIVNHQLGKVDNPLPPIVQQQFWHGLYNQFSASTTSSLFQFMNYGYANDDEKENIPLKTEDEPFRYAIQLYNHVVRNIDLKNKDIIEIGCGRGGGGEFLIQYKHPRSYIGLDVAGNAIQWCKKQYPYSHAQWLEAASDEIPLPDACADIVINVESSHCYPSMENFLKEVIRLLRQDGHFAYCDLLLSQRQDWLEQLLVRTGFSIVDKQIIAPQVLRALALISPQREAQIKEIFAPLIAKGVINFSALKGTEFYACLASGQFTYFSYLLRRI